MSFIRRNEASAAASLVPHQRMGLCDASCARGEQRLENRKRDARGTSTHSTVINRHRGDQGQQERILSEDLTLRRAPKTCIRLYCSPKSSGSTVGAAASPGDKRAERGTSLSLPCSRRPAWTQIRVQTTCDRQVAVTGRASLYEARRDVKHNVDKLLGLRLAFLLPP